MTRVTVCLTIDVDPDGSSKKPVDRSLLRWRGLQWLTKAWAGVRACIEEASGSPLRATWFVRADGQLRRTYGSDIYLYEEYASFWASRSAEGDELAWHPHLYTAAGDGSTKLIEPERAVGELARIHEEMRPLPWNQTSFRNGEAWHTPETLDAVERLGYRCDSSCVPGRSGGTEHPMDWTASPPDPYFPEPANIQVGGPERPLMEAPVSTGLCKAPWDRQLKRRYINPAFHAGIFRDSLNNCVQRLDSDGPAEALLVLLAHPSEIAPAATVDGLVCHDPSTFVRNMIELARLSEAIDPDWRFTTLADAAVCFRAQAKGRVSRCA